MNNKTLKYLLDRNEICYLDYHFAKFATGLSGKEETELLLAAVLVSSKTREGNICIDIKDYAGQCLIPGDENTLCPELDMWLKKLKNYSIIGKPGDYKPLILDDKGRLYLYRYWAYENTIAEKIKDFIKGNYSENGLEGLKDKLYILFPVKGERKSPDMQKVAAFTAVLKKLTIISGGPGTGKTTTVAKILSLLIEQSIYNKSRIRIALAAPTGKAAARLQESIKSFKAVASKDKIIEDEKLALIPEEASTIHRLLGYNPGSPYFRHNSKNPLNLDVLVVDEASMIDVPLMAKLLEALPENARLIILGDKDQLSSVEAGNFMGDLCAGALKSSYTIGFYNAVKQIDNQIPDEQSLSVGDASLRECYIHLTESYRFGGGIGELSKLVNEGNSQAVKKLSDCIGKRETGKQADILIKNISAENMLEKELMQAVSEYYGKFLEAVKKYRNHTDKTSPEEIFVLFDKFRILCAMREGPFGVNRLNLLIESILREKNLITGKKDWYAGMPVMITQNSYSLNLFNGDVGIVLPDRESNGTLKAFFPSSNNTFRKFHQLRLPEYEKVFAMTVHKSQGSEFNTVVLILPDKPNPVLTRELLYTGITRAKEKIEIWSGNDTFTKTIEAKITRSSGLFDSLVAS